MRTIEFVKYSKCAVIVQNNSYEEEYIVNSLTVFWLVPAYCNTTTIRGQSSHSQCRLRNPLASSSRKLPSRHTSAAVTTGPQIHLVKYLRL